MGAVRISHRCTGHKCKEQHTRGESVGKPLLAAWPPVLQASHGVGLGVNLCAANWEEGLSPTMGRGGWAV